MRKNPPELFERFLDLFDAASREAGKRQFVIPYLISAFPGCTDADMRDLSNWLAERNWQPQQVQCFIPLPGTVAAAMYHAEIDASGNPIRVAKSDAERMRQHGILLPSPEKREGKQQRNGHANYRKDGHKQGRRR
jgi:radical SAM superfamily enzyme YgiQ (UPF0313 family)